MISLVFPFAPVPKGRPRFTRRGHTYTPDKTRRFEADLKLWAQKQMVGKKPLTGAVAVSAVFFLAKPKSVRRELPTVKPDLDNFLKCLDALNGVVWNDDAQVITLEAHKFYAMDEAGPRISVVVKEISA